MLFNSLEFLLFFPAVLCVCFILPARVRYIWLLVASYFFYMCWNAKYALLLLFSTAVTYLSGLFMERIKHKDWDDRRIIRWKKLCVAASFGLNLAVLFFFKYFDFAFENLNHLMGLIHVQLNRPAFDVLLPVGISFYTFQALSYTMDVYRDEIYAEKNFLRYALFVSFFPQLVAGPIERSKNLLRQLAEPPRANIDNLREGVLLMLWGYVLKVVLADRIAIMVDTIYGDPAAYAGWYLIVATVLFAFQIYCDFAGYSTIAMGAAKVLGIRLMENFDAPYLARSVGEFWRRWHISLSSWFRDYLYIPLGGNRKGRWRKYFNLMVVFLVSGLWHGANWSFVVWGGLNGLYQIIGELTKPARDKIVRTLGFHRESLGHRVFQMLVAFALVDFSWIFFRAEGIEKALDIIKSMRTTGNPWIMVDGSLFGCGLNRQNFTLMMLCIGLLLGADICKYKGVRIREVIAAQDIWVRWLVFSVAICFILLVGIWGSGYNAANFIYFQF